MRIVREGRFEQRDIARNLFEPVDDRLLVRLPVRDRRGEGLYHLVLKAVTVAAPVNDEIEPGIEDCWGIARMRSLPDTDRLGQPVRSVVCWLMATGTTDISVDRQSGIEEQQPAEIDSLRRNRCGAIALFSASISESSATAAIVTLAFTIGSWVLDF